MRARRPPPGTAGPPEAAVVATERALRRARGRRRRRLLRDLPCLAAGLGALAARDARAQSVIDTRFLFYKESGGRTQVLNPIVSLQQDLGESRGVLGLQLAYDSISGASPTGGYPSLDVTTSASGKTTTSGNFPMAEYKDTRKSVSLSYARKLGDHLPSVDISYAKENDYVARGAGISDSWTMAEGRGTLHLGVSIARDIVEPVTNTLQLPKNTNGFALGWTWVLTERDLVDVSASLMALSGYLDDPYKIVPVGSATANTSVPDHRPDSRSRWAVVAKYGHYYLWSGALKVNYRYYWDDWSVRAHTLDVTYDQYLGSDWIVSPRVRLYTQSAASFYGSLLATPQPYMSADYRLSSFYSWLGGVGLSRRLTGAVSVNAGFTYQEQTGRDRLAPPATSGHSVAGASTVSSADMTVMTLTFGVTYSY
ncbi:MAG: DUF3570 domain-containing protein [Thermoanaerobaculia bacterium]